MLIAFCYDRKSDYIKEGFSSEECIEFDTDDTIESLSVTLTELGHRVVDVGNVKSLVKHLSGEEKPKWDLVFNVTEGWYGLARESQVPALLEAYQIPFTFSDGATLTLCLDKGKTKMVLQHYGIPTAPFAIVPNSGSADYIEKRGTAAVAASPYSSQLTYPLFAKVIAEGSSKGVLRESKVSGPDELNSVIDQICSRYPGQDVLIEKYLAGREITVGLIGTGPKARVLGALECKCNDTLDFMSVDIKNTEMWENKVEETKGDMDDPEVKAACETALKIWRVLGCRDAGRVDMRSDIIGKGAVPHFLEVNPLAGLRPNYSQLPTLASHSGFTYTDLIEMIVTSAVERIDKK
eukprot:TRINITY_DN4124_c0_g1_i1.p1 TRINITY_DN4124_c0_g1~~TRINITY_DN4124_c0_g1_i1.p1  ORF type:complete len:350 (-),score=53.40 TRINITY_DN4124_c0_g1_i1:9-1058(-)